MKYIYLIIFLHLSLLFDIQANNVPRSEYPRPQFERIDWINLNGEWTYTLDLVNSGHERGFYDGRKFDNKIIVPFAPESKLSGVQYLDFIPSIWYQREFTIPSNWSGKDILLNFGAVYYESEIYIDGKFANRHFGGSDSYSVDITKFVKPGKTHSLVVWAKSDLRSRMQSAGKQSTRQTSFDCMYTRTTGIWQTVWMEAVSPIGIKNIKITTDIDQNEVSIQFTMRKNSINNVIVNLIYNNRVISTTKGKVSSGSIINIPIKNPLLWSPETPNLYDLEIILNDSNGKVIDKVKSYFGMRKIHTLGNMIYLNNKPYYQRLVLDQGFYPNGIWTAPSDEALKNDILLSKAAGFNGARLHQKVFEERFHYWADKLGYITWGESPSWGLDANSIEAARNFITEWKNIVNRDINHPSIVTWTPFNEEFWPDQRQYPRFITDIYTLTKEIDPTRPINTVSGGQHIVTDIWTEHHYEQDADKLRIILFDKVEGSKAADLYSRVHFIQERQHGNEGFNRPVLKDSFDFPIYKSEMPYILDEFGGIKCLEANPINDRNLSWGYGNSAKTKEDFYKRLESQVKLLIENSNLIWGFCYTQLTDVELEQNGIYYYDRSTKYDMKRIRSIFQMSLPKKTW